MQLIFFFFFFGQLENLLGLQVGLEVASHRLKQHIKLFNERLL